jgi:hypothetical protein
VVVSKTIDLGSSPSRLVIITKGASWSGLVGSKKAFA